MDRRVTPPKRVTSSIWSPPPPCKQALNLFTPQPRYGGKIFRLLYLFESVDKLLWCYNTIEDTLGDLLHSIALDRKQLSYLECTSNNVKRAFDFCVRTLFLQMFLHLENEGTISAFTKTFVILFDSFSGNTTSFYIMLTRPLCFD